MMTVAALTGDGYSIEGFHQEKGRNVIKSKIWSVDTDKYGLSFMMALDIEKQDPANPKTRRNIKEDIVSWL
jgi:hypothetical protein